MAKIQTDKFFVDTVYCIIDRYINKYQKKYILSYLLPWLVSAAKAFGVILGPIGWIYIQFVRDFQCPQGQDV